MGPWKIAVPETTTLSSADGPLTESDPPIATSPDAVRFVVSAPPFNELKPPMTAAPETESVRTERYATLVPEMTMGPSTKTVPEKVEAPETESPPPT